MAPSSARTKTTRERECTKIARSRAARKRWQLWRRRSYIGCGALVAVVALSLGIWEWRTGGVSAGVGRAVDGVYAMTGRAGFAVRAVSLEGRSRTPLSAVQGALSITSGEPILEVSLDQLRARLEALPTVKKAYVDRQLPSTLRVRLEERRPVAVWQTAGKLHLIDDEGAVMDDLALDRFPNLPLVVGPGAQVHVNEALAVLTASPELQGRINALVRVGDRRWDVHLTDGPEIKLPEDHPAQAWASFVSLAQKRGLLSEPLRTVDLRLPGKMILRATPAEPDHTRGTDA